MINIHFVFSSSGNCADISRLVPLPSPFLCWPPQKKEEKKEIKQNTEIQPAEAKEEGGDDDDDEPYPTSVFPQEFYDSKEWETEAFQKFDWEQGGEVCKYMDAPIYSEKEGYRASLGGTVANVIKKRPSRILPGDFIAFASGEKGFAFYVAQVLKIRVHSIWVHFFGDDFLGMT